MAECPAIHVGKLLNGVVYLRLRISLWFSIIGVGNIVLPMEWMTRIVYLHHHEWLRIIAHGIGG